MALAFASMGLGGGRISLSGLFWVFFHVLAVYNLHGLMTYRQGKLFDLSMRSYYRSRLHRIILGGSLSLSCLLILFAPPLLWLPLLVINSLALFCATPIFPFKGGAKRTKDLPLLKTPLLTFGVACSIIFLPRAWSRDGSSLGLEMEHFFLMAHLFFNVVGGDLSDIRLDTASGVRTWPVQWGFFRVRNSCLLVAMLLIPLGLYLKVEGFILSVIVLDTALYSSLRPIQPKAHYDSLVLPQFIPALFVLATSPVRWGI